MTIPNFIIWKTNRGPLLLSSPVDSYTLLQIQVTIIVTPVSQKIPRLTGMYVCNAKKNFLENSI